jgi:hypothetical protein
MGSTLGVDGVTPDDDGGGGGGHQYDGRNI